MFVLNYTHEFQSPDGTILTIPQGTELYPTGLKCLWDNAKGKRKTARYYIKDVTAIEGVCVQEIAPDLSLMRKHTHEGLWYYARGISFHSHKVSRVTKKFFKEWKATRLDTTLYMG
jgi:hypothetical protein